MMLWFVLVTGLIAIFSPVSKSDCDEFLTDTIGSEGEWSTPGYPLGVSGSVYCYYSLWAPLGSVIDLLFTDIDTFVAPHYSCNANTQFVDHIVVMVRDIRDGKTDTIATLCGSWGPYNRYAAWGFAIGVHITPREGDPSKFAMEWYTRKDTSDHKIISGVDAEWGMITSPGYPGLYYNYYASGVTIFVCKGDIIELKFDWIDIESYDGECDEEVTIYDGPISDGTKVLGEFCGQTTPFPIETKSNAIHITMYASPVGGGMGFKATYQHKYIAHRFDVVKDMTDDEKVVIYMGLYNAVGKLIAPSIVHCEPDWTFTAIATHLDACDLAFTFTGQYNTSQSVVKYMMDMPKGNYMIEFTATAHAPDYKLTRSYTVGWCSHMVEEIKRDYTSKTADVDFIIEEMYDYFSYEALEKLGEDLRQGFQLSLKTVYVQYVTLTRDPYGYIHASVEVRGHGLSTALRPLCSVISSAYPFKFCSDGEVMPIKHGRTIMVGGEKYGFGTDKKCRSAMFNINACW